MKHVNFQKNFWTLTVTIKVDCAWATKTNTSASKQCLSIHSSKFGVISTPGESTNTTSSRSKEHLSLGQNIRTNWLSLNFSSHKAWPSRMTLWNRTVHFKNDDFLSKMNDFKWESTIFQKLKIDNLWSKTDNF